MTRREFIAQASLHFYSIQYRIVVNDKADCSRNSVDQAIALADELERRLPGFFSEEKA